MSISIECAYVRNGNLTRDTNKGMTFTYDLLGHPLAIAGSDNQTDYVYSADGRKFRATHTQGNNRILIGSNGQRDQYSHFYPYGGLIGDISTNSSVQDYKYGGKELDRTYGLDLYDFEARQLDSKLGGFTSIDPLAEKYYSISPYAYCAGDPVNLVDPTGMSYEVDTTGVISYHDDGVNTLTGQTPNGQQTWALSERQEKALNQIYKDQNTEENLTSVSRKKITRGEATDLFKMLASSSYTEWAITETKGNTGVYIFQSNHVLRSDEDNVVGSVSIAFENLLNVNFHIHSHGSLEGSIGPSGDSRSGDRGEATRLYIKSGYISHRNDARGEYVLPVSEDYKLMVYHRYSNMLVKYNPSRSYVVKGGFSQFKK